MKYNDEHKTAKLCLASIVVMFGMWIFIRITPNGSDVNYYPISEYNRLPEYNGM